MRKRLFMFISVLLVAICLMPRISGFADAKKYGSAISVDRSNVNHTKIEDVAHSAAENKKISRLKIDEDIMLMDEVLATRKTDVTTELGKQIERYKEMLLAERSETERVKIQKLIDTISKLTSDYIFYKNTCENNSVIQSRGEVHLGYTPAIAAGIGVLTNLGYVFTAELLSHALENSDQDSVYTPVYGSFVLSSPVFHNIADGSSVVGGSLFQNSGSDREKDLYYAIHQFSYTKPNAISKNVTIKDVFDFEENTFSGLVGLL